jgi:hypothetical protein
MTDLRSDAFNKRCQYGAGYDGRRSMGVHAEIMVGLDWVGAYTGDSVRSGLVPACPSSQRAADHRT